MGKFIQRGGKEYYLIEQSSNEGLLFTRTEMSNAKARANKLYNRG